MSNNVSRETITMEPVVEPTTDIEHMVGRAYHITRFGEVIIVYVVGRSNPRAAADSPPGQAYTVVEYKSDAQAIRLNRYATTRVMQQWMQGEGIREISPEEFVAETGRIVLGWTKIAASAPSTP